MLVLNLIIQERVRGLWISDRAKYCEAKLKQSRITFDTQSCSVDKVKNSLVELIIRHSTNSIDKNKIRVSFPFFFYFLHMKTPNILLRKSFTLV